VNVKDLFVIVNTEPLHKAGMQDVTWDAADHHRVTAN